MRTRLSSILVVQRERSAMVLVMVSQRSDQHETGLCVFPPNNDDGKCGGKNSGVVYAYMPKK